MADSDTTITTGDTFMARAMTWCNVNKPIIALVIVLIIVLGVCIYRTDGFLQPQVRDDYQAWDVSEAVKSLESQQEKNLQQLNN